ncbi:MAG: hypothetical protein FJ291_16950 [Planctomycetes bacterium]|nr:hypothetical protein [Planctomycetota bacterium]
MDASELDRCYFIDEYVYNCPFCNRRHLSYSVKGTFQFKWTSEKPAWAYFVKCDSCRNISMHLSYSAIETYPVDRNPSDPSFRFSRTKEAGPLDDEFFYSVPTSFFVLDERVPRVLRELISEAEGCLKSNFLTGASACARKVVYELAAREKAQGKDYEERVKALKAKHSGIEPAFFDTLLTIQQVTSAKVHEEAYDGWQAKHLRLILSALSEVLREIYVVPAMREEKRKAILELKDEVMGGSHSGPKS